VKTDETGEKNPGQRITSPSFGNALKFAGLRCGLVMRWPPKSVWHLAGQANSSLLPSLLSLPVQKPETRGPAPLDFVPPHRPTPSATRRNSCKTLAPLNWAPLWPLATMRPLAAHRRLSGLLRTSRVAPAAAATPLCCVRAPLAGPPSVTLFTEALSEVWGG
jgi:hypothetical protein